VGGAKHPRILYAKIAFLLLPYYKTADFYGIVSADKTNGGTTMSQSRTQKSFYNKSLVAAMNLLLWPIKAWGLAQDEQDEFASLPTGYLCTGHIASVIVLGIIYLAIGMSLVIAGFVSLLVITISTMVPYLALGAHLRYQVGRRCSTKNYNYVRANLDLLQ